MKIHVRHDDVFDADSRLWLLRGGQCMAFDPSGYCDGGFYQNRQQANRVAIPHDRAFAILRSYGHDPVYVDEAVASPDPHAEWREAVTRMAKQLAKSAGANRDLWNEAANVVAIGEAIEAAQRAKKEAGR